MSGFEYMNLEIIIQQISLSTTQKNNFPLQFKIKFATCSQLIEI